VETFVFRVKVNKIFGLINIVFDGVQVGYCLLKEFCLYVISPLLHET